MTETGYEAANHGVQIFGGHGFIREWGMEQIVRDAREHGVTVLPPDVWNWVRDTARSPEVRDLFTSDGALNAAKAAGRDGIIFVGATNFAVGYEAMGEGAYWGSIYQSPVDDAEAALLGQRDGEPRLGDGIHCR